MFEAVDHSKATTVHLRLPLAAFLAPSSSPRGCVSAPPELAEADDAKLLAQVAQYGDEAAFEDLYARHVQAVTTAAMQVCRNQHVAEDVAQHAFTALWKRADRLAKKSVRLRPWLTTVARNAAIDYLRSGSAATGTLDDDKEQLSDEPCPEQAVLASESSRAVRNAVAALSPKQREAVEFVYFVGMTYQAVADTTGEPLGTIKSRVRLAIGHLRARLGGAYAGRPQL